MSVDSTIVPDSIQITNEAVAPEDVQPEEKVEIVQHEPPLNAEEATILVLHFLQRMRKKIVTPRKAEQTKEKQFTVNVDLEDAKATVLINSETREIEEYTIEPVEVVPKPLPIPSGKIAVILAVVISIIVMIAVVTFFGDNIDWLRESITSDHLIIAAGIGIVGLVVRWWQDRE